MCIRDRYSTEQLYDTSYVIKQEDYTDDEYNILNNYLSGIKNTGEELEKLIEEIESLDEPCVLVAFGDHKPWLGEGNSVYEMLGIDLDVSTLEGFYNYYATPYIMYANDAAKQITGNQFVGEGDVYKRQEYNGSGRWNRACESCKNA